MLPGKLTVDQGLAFFTFPDHIIAFLRNGYTGCFATFGANQHHITYANGCFKPHFARTHLTILGLDGALMLRAHVNTL
jgi:hypothetical protein